MTRGVPTTARRVTQRVAQGANGVRLWFRQWRRTRPFWGGLWTVVAGAWIIHAMSFSIGITLTGRWTPSAGYVMGAGLILFGLVAWLAPFYQALAGLVTFLLALAAFPTANAGGYLVGTVLGLVGAAMVASWGPKQARGGLAGRGARPRGRRRLDEGAAADASA